MVWMFFDGKGFERPAPVSRLEQKQSGGLFLGRGKIHEWANAASMAVGDHS